MIIVDSALEKRHSEGKPIRVAMVGAGFMARGIALQICQFVKGMELVAISNRTLETAKRAYREAGIAESDIVEVGTTAQLEEAISRKKFSVTDNPFLLCEAGQVDAVMEVTGHIEYGARVVMHAIKNGKHVILMNAEVDGTIGSILKTYADKAGVVYTVADGDQPGVIMNLYRFVKGIGVRPVLLGNIKGLHDPYRNPTTQKGFAEKWGQNPAMVTSFADGTKISYEQACVANATGMKVGKRGMFGPTMEAGTPIEKTTKLFPELYDLDEWLAGPGIVDYVVGAAPGPGVFVLGTHEHPTMRHYLNLYKLGEGPLYCFYTPYHLCHFEIHNTVARAVLFNDANLAPIGTPTVEVVTTAKIDLKSGEKLDGLGEYMTYGLAENYDIARAENLLPIGLAEGAILKTDLPKDKVLTFDDVILPEGLLSVELYKEQLAKFPPASIKVTA
ncbi:NAD(P)-dependent oxidoreductase [Xanthocytophaga agilis]|uniref:NAD(P)-dependent oxidoreductase n=1 Tax=Xanthocytophaga agilis TaxID=3048010 RepID=A0AAE3R1F3_9BACT|nr:NAD(P)-dependent oxidoreductase [Xanthocytophaga agilis]MDJ1499857.1 NAD(P)-dependent oxidoreductase [Xanthocytophaga agilis]